MFIVWRCLQKSDFRQITPLGRFEPEVKIDPPPSPCFGTSSSRTNRTTSIPTNNKVNSIMVAGHFKRKYYYWGGGGVRVVFVGVGEWLLSSSASIVQGSHCYTATNLKPIQCFHSPCRRARSPTLLGEVRIVWTGGCYEGDGYNVERQVE